MSETTNPLKQGLARVGRSWKAGRYRSALDEVERLLSLSVDNPTLLVMRAQLAQLQDDADEAPSFEDMESDLRSAAELDERSPVPLLELASFLYAVKDDAHASYEYFDRAVELCQELLREALLGKTKALLELGRDPEAFSSLVAAHSLSPGKGGSVGDELLEQLRILQRAK